MKTKKILCFICLVFFIVTVAFIILETNGAEESIVYEYEAVVNTPSGKSILGSYTIQVLPKSGKVIEIKDYNLVLVDGPANIQNIKTYTYNPQFQLIQYEEVEKYNTEDKYAKSAFINYDLERGQVCINFSETSSENNTILLDNALPYTINSSYILSLLLGCTPNNNISWSCYEGKGFIDNYSCHINELINSTHDQSNYKTIQQTGLFETTYYFNQNGVLVSIEQKMDETYTVIFTLKD